MPRLFSKPGQGYLLNWRTSSPNPKAYDHYLGGELNIDSARCRTCGEQMTRLLTLDTSDIRLETGGLRVSTLPILICHTCVYWVGPFYYQLISVDQVSVFEYNFIADPEWNANFGLLEFPRKEIELLPIDDSTQQIIQRFNDGEILLTDLLPLLGWDNDLYHQIGGEPILIQNNPDKIVLCPKCSLPMPFLASMGNGDEGDGGFFGYPFAQLLVHFCRICQIVAGEIEVD